MIGSCSLSLSTHAAWRTASGVTPKWSRMSRATRRRVGDAVVNRPRVSIHLHAFQTGRVGILQVLNDPQPPAVVELGADRLPNDRLGGDEIDAEAGGDGHVPGGLVGRITLGEHE